ncbi:MAG: hypothetical protein V8S95_13960 [Odoribacter sp.]
MAGPGFRIVLCHRGVNWRALCRLWTEYQGRKVSEEVLYLCRSFDLALASCTLLEDQGNPVDCSFGTKLYKGTDHCHVSCGTCSFWWKCVDSDASLKYFNRRPDT